MIIIGDGQEPEKDDAPISVQTEEDVFAENKKFLQDLEEKAKQNKIDVTTCRYVGKLFNTYLLYERQDEIYIIDQHAAHERLIYDKLREQMQTRTVAQQPMLLPFELRLNAFEATFIKERMDDIISMGFDLQEDGETSFKVYAVPVDLQKINLSTFFNDILGDISGYRAIKLADLLKDKLATAACKAAVKGGMDLTQEEIDKLFVMMDGDMGLKCPHGRPVVVKMSKTQLEKMFKRIV
jgi:DNA mismatch repair protein MutL